MLAKFIQSPSKYGHLYIPIGDPPHPPLGRQNGRITNRTIQILKPKLRGEASIPDWRRLLGARPPPPLGRQNARTGQPQTLRPKLRGGIFLSQAGGVSLALGPPPPPWDDSGKDSHRKTKTLRPKLRGTNSISGWRCLLGARAAPHGTPE
jgi:hypothetical protein